MDIGKHTGKWLCHVFSCSRCSPLSTVNTTLLFLVVYVWIGESPSQTDPDRFSFRAAMCERSFKRHRTRMKWAHPAWSVFCLLGVRSGAFLSRRSTTKPSVRSLPGLSTWQSTTLNFKSQFVVLTMIHPIFFIGYLFFFSLTEFCSMARPDQEFQRQHGKTWRGHKEAAGGCCG